MIMTKHTQIIKMYIRFDLSMIIMQDEERVTHNVNSALLAQRFVLLKHCLEGRVGLGSRSVYAVSPMKSFISSVLTLKECETQLSLPLGSRLWQTTFDALHDHFLRLARYYLFAEFVVNACFSLLLTMLYYFGVFLLL